MPQSVSRTGSQATFSASFGTLAGVCAALLFFLITGALSYTNVRELRADTARVVHTHKVMTEFGNLLSAVQDAETGQRGFLLTGDERYLDPYRAAIARVASSVERIDLLTRDNAQQQASLRALTPRVAAKLAELRETINLRRVRGPEAALSLVSTDRGKVEMDAIRAQLARMRADEQRLRESRLAQMDAGFWTLTLSGLLTTLLGIGLTLTVGLLVHRAERTRQRLAWLQAGEVGLSQAMLGDRSVAELGDSILDFLTSYLGAQASALFKGEDGVFQRTAMLGVAGDAPVPQLFREREGLLGRVAAEGRPTVISDVPDGYLKLGSALGHDRPRHLVIAPFSADGVVNAVVEFGFLHPVEDRTLELLARVEPTAGVALRSARYRTELRNLLEETQRQSEELQVQSEELRVSNEELEEQGRALKETAVRLEQQQVELEQTNSQLEEQAQLLETQRDDLARSSAAIEAKARELEQASQYKSDFLANMSHELRTPLNSLLILSRLLGDNPDGNLTDEQAKYARTIEASGNDLLNLINDILDLSKIEAGHIEMRAEPVATRRLVADLRQTFDPVANDRAIDFVVEVADDMPASIVTDRQRLEQVLKNLLSNAFKFTEQGSVTLRLAPVADGRIAFTVVDTGIGISADQQQAIFEAFRQADGSINRRYGGTGLGLSISRELARLLGGTISVVSTPGQGSSFTVTVPTDYAPVDT
ncbi:MULTISPECIES: CHASE3 domain-containing protein, partial [unclassified Sphingomonas]|uniref:CHASE3 domain-containing protein n=3 Tax=Sphingomonas TaxID=13687 RepID=UPI000A8CC0E5